MGNSAQSKNRVGGLDSIRFICALTIVIFHFGLIPLSVFGPDPHGLALLLRGVAGSLFDGPAALIIFFLISGFGIHFAFRHDLSVNVPSFFSRRLIRAGGPALVALVLWAWAGIAFQPQGPGPFWTVTCEIEYYLLYPILLLLRRRFGWWPLILVALVAAYGLALSNVPDIVAIGGGYPAFGWWNWVVGLPCWMTGCWLAESFERFPTPSTGLIWLIRGFIYAISVGLQILRFHGASVYLTAPFTLNLFALVAVLWLGMEVAYRRVKPAPRILEWAGNWTYSLYLMHPTVPGFFVMLPQLRSVLNSGAGGLIGLVCAIAFAYPFHLAIEAPSYRLAIAVSRKLKTIRPPASLAVQQD
jgi:peptidoglycan/LPS O-acetylase OafA/YrhL